MTDAKVSMLQLTVTNLQLPVNSVASKDVGSLTNEFRFLSLSRTPPLAWTSTLTG